MASDLLHTPPTTSDTKRAGLNSDPVSQAWDHRPRSSQHILKQLSIYLISVWSELVPGYHWNGVQKAVVYFGYTRQPHFKYFTKTTSGNIVYHVLTAAVLQQHFCTAEAVDGVASIVQHSRHTRTQRQEPNSRVSRLPPALLSNVTCLWSKAKGICRMSSKPP